MEGALRDWQTVEEWRTITRPIFCPECALFDIWDWADIAYASTEDDRIAGCGGADDLVAMALSPDLAGVKLFRRGKTSFSVQVDGRSVLEAGVRSLRIRPGPVR